MPGSPKQSPVSPVSRPLNIGRAAWTLIRRFGCPALALEEATRRAEFCVDAGNAVSADEWRCVHRKIMELGYGPGGEAIH